MQAKEVDARLEIKEGRVLPLRLQRESFAYHADLKVLEEYYRQLWLIYVFVSPAVYDDRAKCKKIVDAFCQRYEVEEILAYKKVRRYRFRLEHDVIAESALEPLERFFKGDGEDGLRFADTPSTIVASVIAAAAKDKAYLRGIKDGDTSSHLTVRIGALFQAEVLDNVRHVEGSDGDDGVAIGYCIDELRGGTMSPWLQNVRRAARTVEGQSVEPRSFQEYRSGLIEFAKAQRATKRDQGGE